jgi:hypothetical protein
MSLDHQRSEFGAKKQQLGGAVAEQKEHPTEWSFSYLYEEPNPDIPLPSGIRVYRERSPQSHDPGLELPHSERSEAGTALPSDQLMLGQS